MVYGMHNPPDHAKFVLGITMIILTGEGEFVATLAQAAAKKLVAKKVAREVGEEAGEQAVKTVVRSKPSSKKLGEALEAAGHVRPPNSAAHHIVAGSARKAAPARKALERLGIDINDASNGVFLPAKKSSPNPLGATVHSPLHGNAYYDMVNQRLANVTTRAEAEAALNDIRQILLAGQ